MGFGDVLVVIVAYCLLVPVAFSEMHMTDAEVMQLVKKGISNLGDLDWSDPDPCNWAQVQCAGAGEPDEFRVTHILIRGRGLEGTLPDLGSLVGLREFDVSWNHFSGPAPTLPTANLDTTLYLNSNNFSSMPSNFFSLSLLGDVDVSDNPFSEWEIPDSLIAEFLYLRSFKANSANLVGPIPDHFGHLDHLELGDNRLEGCLPASFAYSLIQTLRLDNVRTKSKLSGTITVLQNMTYLTEVVLNGNHFTGPLPDLTLLKGLNSFRVRHNDLTGIVPLSLVALESLQVVHLRNNHLQGPTPKFDPKVEVDLGMINDTNSFCSDDPGVVCDPRVDILLSIAQSMRYPLIFAENWKGYDPCDNTWLGITCSTSLPKEIVAVNFQSLGLSGNIPLEFSMLDSLEILVLSYNAFSGYIPPELTLTMPNLKLLDVSNNDLYGSVPLIYDNPDLVVQTEGNPHFGGAP